MSDETEKPVKLYWKLAAFRISGKAMIAVALSVAQGLNGILHWNDLTETQQFVMVALAVGAGWAIIDAFLDTTMAEIRKHKSLTIPNGTEIIKRNDVAPDKAEP